MKIGTIELLLLVFVLEQSVFGGTKRCGRRGISNGTTNGLAASNCAYLMIIKRLLIS